MILLRILVLDLQKNDLSHKYLKALQYYQS